ncbi:MAG TPA: carboxypeptidase regulatory-like domain-containing protein, partial [Vicinamibacterales bacterium]
APVPTGRITGHVVAGDNGRPVKRARVFAAAAELEGGRGMLTDDNGVFDFTELPAGRYTITASKSGFVSLSYGQRRPLQSGTPLQLVDGQQLKDINFQLPRGSVIGGHVLDEDGDAMPGVMVRVMRYEYLQGERRLTPAGNGQTDDKGQYRVWGLMPGDYYINAVARSGGPGGFGGPGGPGNFGGRGGGRGGGPAVPGASSSVEQVNYAPTYYPGVPSIADAKPVTVGLGAETLDINFGMQLVRMSRLSGHIENPDGTPVTSGNVNLTADTSASRSNQIGMSFGGRIDWDGSFAINGVPPGRFTLRARGNDSDTPQFASQPVTVNGDDLSGITVVLSGGATVSGTVTFQTASTSTPDLSQFRISAPPVDQGSFGPQPNARVDKDGHFTLEGVPAGGHLFRSGGNARGFILKSVTVNGRNVTDTPVELRSDETVSGVAIVFTDQQNEINGTLTTEQGAPLSEFTILVFPTDASLWRPQARQIMTTRPDQTGKYRLRGLPPGEYFVVAVDPAEQGEWFEPAYLDEHRAGATRLTLSDGDVKTQDLKVAIR